MNDAERLDFWEELSRFDFGLQLDMSNWQTHRAACKMMHVCIKYGVERRSIDKMRGWVYDRSGGDLE